MSHQPKISSNKTRKDDVSSTSANQSPSHDLIRETLTFLEKKYLEDGWNYSKIYTFGSNEMGQLGLEIEYKDRENGDFTYRPMPLLSLANSGISSISAGDSHTIAVCVDGSVYAWGASACGQLGLNGNESMPRDSEGYPYQPIPVPIKLMSVTKIKDVACGDAHTIALTVDGKLFSWGGAGCGQLGHHDIINMPKDADNCPFQPFPRLIDSLKTLTVTGIACGKAHSLAIDSTGSLFTWGAGACGQLGVDGIISCNIDIPTLPMDDDGYPYQPVPKYIKSLKGNNIISGVCGDVHTLILSDKGEVFSFGGGSYGQLGLGPINNMPLDPDRFPYMPIPTKIESLCDLNITMIAAGDLHSIAVDNMGRLFAWGSATCGRLGLEYISYIPKDGDINCPEPQTVEFFNNMKVIDVTCGEAHTLALVEGGIIYSFGDNSLGQLGYQEIKENKIANNSIPKSLQSKITESINYDYIGINSNLVKPRLIKSLFGKRISKIACGGIHNIVLTINEPPISLILYRMMKEGIATDFEIISCGNSFKCHKYVLITRSPYFYERIIKNKESERLVLDNYEFNSLKIIVEFLYLNDSTFLSTKKTLNSLLDFYKIAK